MAFPDVTDSLRVQGISSEVEVDGLQRFWLNGILFGDTVPVGTFNNGSTLTDENDSDPLVLRNVKYISVSQAQVDSIQATNYGPSRYGVDTYGGDRDTDAQSIVNLPLSTSVCQLHIHVTSDMAIRITSAKFYAYDGVEDTRPYPGITFYAAEAGQTTSWVTANGFSQALTCQNQALSVNHDWFIAISASPTSTAPKQGKIKFLYTYDLG